MRAKGEDATASSPGEALAVELSAYAFSILREGPLTLTRGRAKGLAPIILAAPTGEYPAPGLLQRLEHEHALREELDPGWAARPLALATRNGRLTLVLEDPGGEPLDRLLDRPMDVMQFLRIAIPLAGAIGRMHARGLIHKDIKPANILVDRRSGGVWLTGFGIASRLPREHQVPAPPEVIAGTLAYMAPEQTGRMNRSVDSRSDLYALGVTFYEMLAGEPPFAAADPMEWIHCHIARQPVPPDERVAGIPEMLAAIVLKLLAKTAEDRYQTAAGLASDLQRCLAEWEATGGIEPFPLGARDASDRMLIPERLYGREREIGSLLEAFHRVVAMGSTELVLVSGYSGIGKSSVVNELHKGLVRPRALFASGKFDQYKRDIPYATIAAAFQSLVRSLLGRSEAELTRWRETLSEAVGPNGQLIVNLVPDLELVIGAQPPVADLAPQDAQRRFHMVFARFLGVFARKQHPLALFLDDLQWLDTATLDLIEHLATNPEVGHLLLVGAYRENEIGPEHPLPRMLEAIRKAATRVQEIVLAPLGLEDIGRLVADALHCPPKRAEPLAQLVHQKTSGNPFFAIQFLTALADEGLLSFDPDVPAWRWDMSHIRARSYTENVVDLMAGKLRRLSAPTQAALQDLACLGNMAEIATLSLVHQKTEEEVHAALWKAVHAGLVCRQDGSYKFLHDRIQQAAYSLIPQTHRAEVHLRIGRALLASMTPEDLSEHLFDIASQFNRGALGLVDRKDRAKVATLELRAGRKAKASTAYASACVYLSAGMALLSDGDWSSQYDLMFALRLERAECEFLTGNLDKAEALISELLSRGASKIDQAAASHLKVQLHVVKGENPRAVENALDCLRLFGIDLPAHPSWEQVQAEYEMVWRNLEERSIEGLIELPLMTDPDLQAAMRLLSVLDAPAYYTDFHLFCLHLCRMVNLSVQHGTSGAAAHAYGWLGFILGPAFHRYHEGYRLARVACDLVEKRGFIAYEAKVRHAMGWVAFWTQPIGTALDFNRTAFRAAVETGDLTDACFSLHQAVAALLLRNDPLDAVWRETERGLDFVRRAGFRDVADIMVSQQRFIATMQGRTQTFSTFSDAEFDETAFEAQLGGGRSSFLVCWYWILKLKARYLSGDYTEALAAADKAKPLLHGALGLIHTLDFFYYAALTLAALHQKVSAEEQRAWRDLLSSYGEQLREWAMNYPPTFGDKHALVSAEIARLEGHDGEAMRLYEQAIQAAGDQGFIQNQGLAHELAGEFYLARGYTTGGRAHLKEAHSCFARWGAEGKVRQLEERYPQLRGDRPRPTPSMFGASPEQLDIGAVVKASQALSGEIVLGRFIETLMTVALEHAGADRGLLVLLRGDRLQVEAEARAEQRTVAVSLREDAATSAELPESLLHTVIRTKESVILDDASAPNAFSADAYIRRRHPRSVLCLPLVKQAELAGLLYLENNLAPGAFTPARISILKLLSSQMAISLENARLYADLSNENRDRRKAEDALRESERLWRSLFENTLVGIALTNTEGRYVAVNAAYRRMFGYSEAELLKLSPLEITHEDDRAASGDIIAAHAAGRLHTLRLEKRYRTKTGDVVWTEVSASTVSAAGSTPLIAGFVLDITDRKRAEENLRRSEAFLAQAQEITQTGSWRWNVATGEVGWSTEHFRIFGFDPAATQPSYETFMERIEPDDRVAFERTLETAVSNKSPFQMEYRITLPDGTAKRLQSVGRPDITSYGELEFVGTVMDITERRRAEEALRDAQADLAHVARLTTMGQLVASIAHEINQPLTAIVSNGDTALLWLNRDKPDIGEARNALSRIVRDAMRAGGVIRGLRALAIKSGPELATFDINDAIREVLTLTGSELKRHGVLLRAELLAGGRRVVGDRVQLQQVLLNLVMNAIEAMKPITARSRELTVSSTLAEAGSIVVAVEDTGTGLAPEIAQRIFEPFFTTKPDGLGMGLSICRSIVEAHGGRLWASPREPHGTVVRFTVSMGNDG